MARNYETQHLFQHNGYLEDIGSLAFDTTDAEIEIYTPLSKIYEHSLQIVAASADTNPIEGTYETLWLDEIPSSTDYSINVSGGSVTARRARGGILTPLSTVKTVGVIADDAAAGFIASNNYVLVPVGYAPFAGTITGLRVWLGTAYGAGTPIINLGKVSSTVVLTDTSGATNGFVVGEEVAQATSNARGVVVAWDDDDGDMTPAVLTVRTLEGEWTTGEVSGADGAMTPNSHIPNAPDGDFFITDLNAWGMPEVDHFLDIRAADITVGAAANQWASVTLAQGDLIMFSTTGGSNSGPGGLHVEVDMTPTAVTTLTSGLRFVYNLKGID